MTSTKREDSVATITSNPSAWSEWGTSADRLPLFSVSTPDTNGGEPTIVSYTMPAKPNPGLALRFLRMAREQGELASSWLIETAIGSEGYDALTDELINYEGDPVDLLRTITEKIQRVAMGGLEGPKA